MTATLIVSIVLACAICMAWFGAARQHSDPRHYGDREGAGSGSFWILVFAICLAAWWIVRFWGTH
ncbi:hypothetical protein [Luteolibacter sp. Populi]|uniref:hypothetical protein n=1 Tax=Luteolibacter sp. Populi TaxID=3230487 RepID=UPI003466C2AE